MCDGLRFVFKIVKICDVFEFGESKDCVGWDWNCWVVFIMCERCV